MIQFKNSVKFLILLCYRRARLSVHSRNERRIAYNAFGVIKGEVEPGMLMFVADKCFVPGK